MTRFYPVSVVLFIAVVIAACFTAAAQLGIFLSIASLLVVLGLPATLIFASHAPREIGAAFSAPYRSSDTAELKKAIGFFILLSRYLLWSGFLATMIGVITLLANLGDESSIGSGAALALITVFYSIVLNLALALPFRHAAEKRMAELA